MLVDHFNIFIGQFPKSIDYFLIVLLVFLLLSCYSYILDVRHLSDLQAFSPFH